MHLRPFLVAAALLSGSLVARADVFTFTISDPVGIFTDSGTLTTGPSSTAGAQTVSSIMGTTSIGGLIPGGFHGSDDLFFPLGTSFFDGNGISFYDQNPFGVYQVNVYSSGSAQYTAFYNEINTAVPNSGTVPVTFTATSTTSPTVTPEPSSLLLLGTGILGVLGTARRRLFA